MKQHCGIYVIENTVNGKQYVGSSVHIARRRRYHFGQLQRGAHGNPHLQQAFNKYGEAAFTCRILEECPAEMLVEREQYWIDTLNTVEAGYNICPAAGSCLGLKHTDEARANIAAAVRRRYKDPAVMARHDQIIRARWADPEMRARMQSGIKAARNQPEDRARTSEQTRASWNDPDIRARRSAGVKAARSAPEARARTRERTQAMYDDPAKREHQSQLMSAIWADPVKRAQRSARIKAAYNTPERRARVSAQMKARNADPVERELLAERQRAKWTDPDYRVRTIRAATCGLKIKAFLRRWNKLTFAQRATLLRAYLR